MFLSNLLGPVKKPIFEIMYRSSLRVAIQLEETGIELKTFSSRFLRLAQADNLKIDVVESQRYFYLIEKIAWLILIPPEQDLQIVRAEFLERLTYTNDVVGAFVLVCGFPPRWAWAQVSEGKRMKAQARKREAEMQESVQMAVYS